jgi:tetratricopeptide (TPR) repeat protein
MESSQRAAERRSRRAHFGPVILTISLLFAGPEALAQGDKAAAETLFQAGITLMSQGKYAEACPKLAESQRADPSSGTLLNLGSCYEKTGRPASAWATFKEAAALARSQGQPEREATANGRIAALEPTLSTLRIDAGDMPGMVVKRDGLEVGRGSLGVPIAVDPGEHVITAAAPEHEEWKATVTVGPNTDAKAVTVPPLRKKAEPTSSRGGGADSSGGPAEPRSGSGLRTAAFVAGGVGLAAIGVGAIFGGLALGDQGDADPLCPAKQCDAGGKELIDSASTKALVSTLGFGIGLAAVGAGVTLYFIGSSAQKTDEPAEEAPSAKVVPWMGATGGGLVAIGRF